MQVSGQGVKYRTGATISSGPFGPCPVWGAERHDYTTRRPKTRFMAIFGASVKSVLFQAV